MRRARFVAIAAVSIALVFSSVPLAFAGRHGGFRGHPVPYRISKPSVATNHVVMGVSFDATGLIVPGIAADDTSTSVAVEVYSIGKHGRPALVTAAPAALSAAADTRTVYAASLTMPQAGPYLLVAAVSRDGVVVARSAARPVFAALPYEVSRPRMVSPQGVAGVSFDATGVVVPGIAADEASTTVSVLVLQRGRRHSVTQVASFDATLTAVDAGTGYAASVTLPTSGKYVLVAVVMRDGVVLGRSGERPLKIAVAPATETARRHHSHH
jgi:hypothetical protein